MTNNVQTAVTVRPPQFETDLLGREAEAARLTTMLDNANSPFVFGLMGRWGTGKSTFFSIWQRHLKDGEKKFHQFNAWEHDYHDDPLIPFIGSFSENLGEDKKKEIAGKAAKVALTFGPTAVRILTGGLVDSDRIADQLGKFAHDWTEERIQQYKQEKRTIDGLRTNIEKIVKQRKKRQKNYYVFIDELDRCKPNFALALLERIKHVLDVKGVVFILAMDQRQIHSIISKVYGDNCDPEGYLRRFIDIEYALTQGDTITLFVENLFKKLNMDTDDPILGRRKELVEIFAVQYNLPLRHIEQAVCYIVAASLHDDLDPYELGILAGLVMIKVCNKTMFEKIKQRAQSRAWELIAEEEDGSVANELFNSICGIRFPAESVVEDSERDVRVEPPALRWLRAGFLVSLENRERLGSFLKRSAGRDKEDNRFSEADRLEGVISDHFSHRSHRRFTKLLRLAETP